jgi:hypothetical protein
MLMLYPWPIGEVDVVLQEALDIALDYLELTGQSFPFSETQRICAHAILASMRKGNEHRIRLANDAINAIENKHAPVEKVQSFYPRVS